MVTSHFRKNENQLHKSFKLNNLNRNKINNQTAFLVSWSNARYNGFEIIYPIRNLSHGQKDQAENRPSYAAYAASVKFAP